MSYDWSDFWAAIEQQLIALSSAKSADDVAEILGDSPGITGGMIGFFAGSGGDGRVWGSLMRAGWDVEFTEFDYWFTAFPPGDGDGIKYIEGDVFRVERS